jgi:hypothetical protein
MSVILTYEAWLFMALLSAMFLLFKSNSPGLLPHHEP